VTNKEGPNTDNKTEKFEDATTLVAISDNFFF